VSSLFVRLLALPQRAHRSSRISASRPRLPGGLRQRNSEGSETAARIQRECYLPGLGGSFADGSCVWGAADVREGQDGLRASRNDRDPTVRVIRNTWLRILEKRTAQPVIASIAWRVHFV